MYRDDREAADALAEKLKRDNAGLEDEKATLERENARLREELAARPPKPAKKPKKDKKNKTEESRADKKKRQAAARRRAYSKGPVYNWTVRIAVGLVVAVVSFSITRALYPLLNHGLTGTWAPIFGALINQVWALMLISQPLLGWWLDEDAVGGVERLTGKQRAAMIAGGVLAVVVTAAFGAVVGESSGGF